MKMLKTTGKYVQMQKTMNDYKDSCDLSFQDFLNRIMQMNEADYIKCIRSSLSSPKLFLKWKPKQIRISLFNKTVLSAWKANLDIQFVLEPYAYAMYIVGYISKSQRGMSAQLDTAAKEARNRNFDLKKQVRHQIV